MKKLRWITVISVIVIALFMAGYLISESNWYNYHKAIRHIEDKKYYKALEELKKSDSYRDSKILWEEIFEIMNCDTVGICGLKPTVSEGNVIYQMESDGNVTQIIYEDEIKQILSGESLCILDMNGRIHFTSDWYEYGVTSEEYLPLTSAYTVYVIDTLIKMNQTMEVSMLGRSIEGYSCKVLLENGKIAGMIGDNLEQMSVSDKKISYLSGDYALTEDGMLYRIKMDYADGMETKSAECVYDANDIVVIDANEEECCMAITKMGNVLYFGGNKWGEGNVKDWSEVISVEISRLFSVGLTREGKILFAGDIYDKEQTDAFFEDWNDIKAIAADRYGNVIGIRENGEVLWAFFDSDGSFKMNSKIIKLPKF